MGRGEAQKTLYECHGHRRRLEEAAKDETGERRPENRPVDDSPEVLHECHGHVMADGVSYAAAAKLHGRAPNETHIRAVFEDLCARNILYFRDGGDRFGVSELAKAIAPEYGIDYATPLFILHREGFYGDMYGVSYNSMREAAKLIREAKRDGADFIKTAVSGMLDFSGDGSVMGDSIGKDELRELVNIASGEGLRVMAHCNGAENIKNALEAGIASIEHGFWADAECLQMLKETGAVWAPTLAPIKNVVTSGRFPEKTMRAILEHHEMRLREAAALGVSIASGSDCGAYLVPHGQGTRDEYAALAALGIDPARANEIVAQRFRPDK